MRYIWREQETADVGIDGEIEQCRPRAGGDGAEATGRILKLEWKSGASLVIQAGATESRSNVAVFLRLTPSLWTVICTWYWGEPFRRLRSRTVPTTPRRRLQHGETSVRTRFSKTGHSTKWQRID
jgi:hypothetical protein